MDRFGVFVDAGYLFAAAGELCCGTRDRRKLTLDHHAIAGGLASLGRSACGLEHLRTYWYDGAPNATATAQHISIARLPAVKVRLGRLSGGRQKGVDSRIVRDLIILSQERAISVAYLLGGDGDLLEGVTEAQERGVRVVLLAIERATAQNLALTLTMEADDIVTLGKDFFQDKISLVAEDVEVAAPVPQPSGGPPAPVDIGRELGVRWVATVTPDDVRALLAARPRIPAELDRPLLRHGTERLGKGHLEDVEREHIRAGFWDAITVAAEPPAAS